MSTAARHRPVVPAAVLAVVAASALAFGALIALLAGAAPAAAATPRAAHVSLPAIENQVMCVTCKIPLSVAQSPQAARERAFIAELIAEGRDETQIKDALVAQYGQQVLALPSTHGFDLVAYVVPVAAVVFVLGALALLLPRWRRRARAAPPDDSRPPAADMSAADTARLEADLAHFD